MIKENQKIKIKINRRNKEYWESKGYNVNLKDIINVFPIELPDNSRLEVEILCDFCLSKGINTIFKNRYSYAIKNKNNHCCYKCRPYKTINTNIKKFGCKHAIQNEEIRSKIKQTNLDKYGVENPYQIQKCKDKIKERYGVDSSLESQIIREKIKLTNLERYGVECVLQSTEIREKINKTMYQNGTVPCSKPQKYIYELLNNLSECKLNYPIGKCNLDIAYLEEMIYIEYDGAGHDKKVKCGWQTQGEFNKNERQRQYYLKNKGWKLIRILSNDDKLPSDEKIIELINECKDYLLHSDRTWIRIDLNNKTIECHEFIKNFN